MSKTIRTKFATLLLATIIATTTVSSVPVYATPTNVSAWADSTVKGFLGNTFDPNMNYRFKATRAELAEILELALADSGFVFNEPTSNPFKDTTNKSAIKMYNAGLLAGIGNGLFGPNDSLTREQMAVILTRVYEKIGVPMTKKQNFAVTDANLISTWARPSVIRCYEAGLIVGDSTRYNPKAVVPREQAIVILSRTKTVIEEHKKNETEKPPTTESDIVDTALYTYNKKTGDILIKRDCKLDVNQQGTPKEFNQITVAKGVTLHLNGVKAKTIELKEDSDIVLENATATLLLARGGNELSADKATVVTDIKSYGTLKVDAKDSKFGELEVFEGDTRDTVQVDSTFKSIKIDAPVKATINGEVDKLSISSGRSVVTVRGRVDDIKTLADGILLDIDRDSRISSIALERETDLSIHSSARVRKLSVEDDAMGSKLDIKSRYDIDITVKTRCTINGNRLTKDSKVEYVDGNLYVDDKDTPNNQPSTGDARIVSSVMSKLTYSYIIGNNKNEDSIVNNLILPTELDGCTLVWLSNNEAVITPTGRVNQIDRGVEVELRVRVSKGSVSENKVFSVFVLAKEKPLAEKLREDLAKVTLPTTATSPTTTLPTQTTGGYTLSYISNSPNALISGNTLTVKQTETEQTVTITVKATSGTTFAERTFTLTIPAKTTTPPDPEEPTTPTDPEEPTTPTDPEEPTTPTDPTDPEEPTDPTDPTDPEEPTDPEIDFAPIFSQLNIPSILTTPLTLPNTVDSAILTYSSESPNLKVTKNTDTTFVEGILGDTPTTVKLVVTANKGGKVETKEYSINLPAKDSEIPVITEDLILIDMETILSSMVIGDTVPNVKDANLEGVGQYLVEITTESRYVNFVLEPEHYKVDFNNLLLSSPREETVVVALTYWLNGNIVMSYREFTIVVPPKYSTEEWKAILSDAVLANAQDKVSVIPRNLMDTSNPINTNISIDVEGVDFHGRMMITLGGTITAPILENDKLSIEYDKLNYATLKPKVLDGSTVDVEVHVGLQFGHDILSTKIVIPILLEDISSRLLDMQIKADIFGIIRTVDVFLESDVILPNFDFVIKDKNLGDTLGTAYNVTLEEVDGKYKRKIEISISKEAIIDNYTYEIKIGDAVIRTGDLLHGVESLTFTEEK